MNAVRKNTEAFLVANEVVGLKINTEKTEYIFMPRQQNVGQNWNISVTNKSIKIQHI
jgi:hypothetical protein